MKNCLPKKQNSKCLKGHRRKVYLREQRFVVDDCRRMTEGHWIDTIRKEEARDDKSRTGKWRRAKGTSLVHLLAIFVAQVQ